jgi:hypothetical protein
MSFRRGKTTARESLAWMYFVEVNSSLLQASGVPISIYKSREMFDDLLMHGWIDHHSDPTHFSVEHLSQQQLEVLVEVIVEYLRFGFSDPGIVRFKRGPTSKEIIRRAQEEW